MPAKKPISLTVFGILLIACGLFLLYTFVLYLLNKPWTALVFDFGGILFFVSFFIFPPGLVVGFIVSGFGVLRAKPWARYLLLITTGFGLWGLVNRLILLGPCTEEFFYISRFFVGGLFLWFFNRKSVRPVFPYRKGLKVLTIVWIIVISLEFIGAGVFWFSQRKYYSYILNLQPAVYQSKDESFYSRDYFRSPFPLKYTLAIPNGFTPTLKKNDITGTEISLWSPKKGFISMGDPTFLQEMYSSGKVFGYGNPYRYFEKEYSERFGLFFMLLNVISRPMGVDRLEKVEIDGLRGFMYRGERKGKVLSHFFLFRGGEAMGQ